MWVDKVAWVISSIRQCLVTTVVARVETGESDTLSDIDVHAVTATYGLRSTVVVMMACSEMVMSVLCVEEIL